jgi:hypothetical protein
MPPTGGAPPWAKPTPWWTRAGRHEPEPMVEVLAAACPYARPGRLA